MDMKALSFTAAIIAAAFCAGSASAQVITISPGYGYAADYGYAPSYGYGYTSPVYAAPAPAYPAPAPSVTVVISPPAATYVAPAAPAYGYTAPAYAYEARPVPPAPIPSYGYVAPPAYAETDYDYADSGYAYAPSTRYVTRGYASTARVCWHDSFGIRRCR